MGLCRTTKGAVHHPSGITGKRGHIHNLSGFLFDHMFDHCLGAKKNTF